MDDVRQNNSLHRFTTFAQSFAVFPSPCAHFHKFLPISGKRRNRKNEHIRQNTSAVNVHNRRDETKGKEEKAPLGAKPISRGKWILSTEQDSILILSSFSSLWVLSSLLNLKGK
jgi:hypothetical protein